MDNPILTTYRNNAAHAQGEVDKYTRLINIYSFLRLGIFVLLAIAIAVCVKTGGISLLIVLTILLLLGFAWLMSRQAHFEEQRRYFIDLKTVNENEIDGLAGWQKLYDDGTKFGDEKHHYTSDLDIFGRSSLFQLTNRAVTRQGLKRLAGWFSAPSDKNVILTRQKTVKELATRNDWKLDLQARLLFARTQGHAQMDSLFAYLRTPLQIPGVNFLTTYLRMAPILFTTAVVAGFWLPFAALLAVLVGLFHIGINIFYGRYVMKADWMAGKIGQMLQQYARLFKTLEETQWTSADAARLSGQLVKTQTSARIRDLGIIVNRLSYSMIIVVGFVLNIVFLWSLKQMLAIESWKADNQEGIADAFEVLGEFEALLSLAGLHINYPDWAFPQIEETKGYTWQATAVAHPLIRPEQRVSNDFDLQDALRIDIITGSNMAGKSTFLRTVGINTVLGLCGAPACAQQLTLSVIQLVTYMRIKDSLSESTSTFKAELDRLQMLLAAVEHEEKVYFLVDEMLRGTNSVDKYLGSKAVIEQLIRKQGVGLVATHDLQLSELEQQYPHYIRNFYFDIQVNGDEMLFDYKIKPGACKTFNASMLLRRIGIEALG